MHESEAEEGSLSVHVVVWHCSANVPESVPQEGALSGTEGCGTPGPDIRRQHWYDAAPGRAPPHDRLRLACASVPTKKVQVKQHA